MPDATRWSSSNGPSAVSPGRWRARATAAAVDSTYAGIVRLVSQYFYPQSQTKVRNEGTATYVHYRIMHRLHQQGRISDGNFLEFLQSHTNVVFQPDFDDPRFSGFNPYALGFAMMQDIERIVSNPDDEDREWFPDIAGGGDVIGRRPTRAIDAVGRRARARPLLRGLRREPGSL